jgi:tetratricopeptide (TPR) repeat protein/predicted Ser/Thr protein kinase
MGAPAGERVGAYVKAELIGRGGFGEVWRAWDERLSRWVALKLLRQDDAGDERERFVREAQTAATLSHANIAAVYDVGEHDGRPYIAMQIVDGSSLQNWKERDALKIVRTIRDAARAVEHAHERGIIHRDLKPANIMTDSSGAVYVMDFGCARSTRVASSLTMSGMLVGTPAYMSPEQARGDRADARSDVYMLGATLYELLAGRRPFGGEDLIDVLTSVANDPPPPIAGVDPSLHAVVMKCLEKDPVRRYPTAGALASDLDRWLRHEPVQARVPGAATRVATWARRHRVVVGALVCGTVGLAVAAGVIAMRIARAEQTIAERAEFQRIRDAIREARTYSYVGGPDVRARLAQVEEAVRELEKTPARDADTCRMLGVGSYELGDLARAEEMLRAAERLAPSDRRVSAALARVYVDRALTTSGWGEHWRAEAERFESRARPYLERLEGGDEFLTRDMLSLMRAYFDGDVPRVQSICQAAFDRLQSRPGEEEYWLVLAVVAHGDSRIEMAGHALRVRPHFPRALVWRAHVLSQAGRDDEAAADLEHALDLCPRMPEVYVNRAALRSKRGDVRGAIDDATRALELDPSLAPMYMNRAVDRLKVDDEAGAMADFAEAQRLAPELADIYYNRANVLSQRGRAAEALADCEEALKRDPEHAHAHHLRGLLRRDAGNLEGARADFTEAIRRKQDPYVFIERAKVRAQLEDLPGAIDDCTEAMRLAPTLAEPVARRGLFRMYARDAQGAVEDLTRAIDLAPDDVQNVINRAIARFSARDVDGSIADCDEAIRRAPHRAEPYVTRGAANDTNGRLREAEADFAKALEVAPADWPRRADTEGMLADVRRRLAKSGKDE